MTNKEAKDYLTALWVSDDISIDETIALEMAIKALEQQPCEDYISRAKAIEEADKLCLETDYDNEQVIEMLNDLPSVTPKEKTGRWISFGIQGEIDGQIVKVFACSECGAISIFRVSNRNIVNGDLCPNCGARMQEVENDSSRVDRTIKTDATECSYICRGRTC